VGRHDRLGAQLAGEGVLAALADGDAEGLALFAVIDIADPEAILAGTRYSEIAPARGGRLCGRGADGVPFALAALAPLGADAWPGDAPRAGRLLGPGPVGPVGKLPLDACKPLGFEPDIDGGIRRTDRDTAQDEEKHGRKQSHGWCLGGCAGSA